MIFTGMGTKARKFLGVSSASYINKVSQIAYTLTSESMSLTHTTLPVAGAKTTLSSFEVILVSP